MQDSRLVPLEEDGQMRESYGESVSSLKPNEVFVFGSNWDGKKGGFHGAGAAGFASFGVSGNRWRDYDYANKPDGWKGKWNVKGRGEGMQEGTEGKSYALPTVTRAGAKQSLTRDQIIANIQMMYQVARFNHSLRFLVAGSSAKGGTPLCGYSHEELCEMYREAGVVPENVIFSDSYTKLIFPVVRGIMISGSKERGMEIWNSDGTKMSCPKGLFPTGVDSPA
jgi:hypothetical protein